MCLRNDNGDFIRAKTSWYHGLASPHETEVWGLKKLQCFQLLNSYLSFCNSMQ
ncbi:hypothetical protein MTR_6g069580 [Medicago truncatula]|uniref:Uncharacterized protein n=1 Tax=Medicago truncatula TaxID=3880 RepID=G7KPT5_MEDTR|nr:hypothetical protein MTR_6g069580 [Medicago truncatula]